MSKKIFEQMHSPMPKRRELSDNPVKLCNEISRIFRARMRESCDIDGVMSQQGARLVLATLAISDGISQRTLVEQTHLRPPTVSLIIKRMLEEGLVELAADPKDMRVTLVYLTDAGRATDRENIEKIKATDAIGLSGISEDEARTLMSLLGRIRDNLLMCEGENEKNI